MHNGDAAGDDWLHEIKYDGYRLLCRKDGERVDCFTRRGHRWSNKFPAIAKSVRRLPADRVWLDGELVLMLKEGISCFSSLQQAVATRDRHVWRNTLLICKKMLCEMIVEGEWNLRAIDLIRGHGPEFILAACKQKLESIISKEAVSCYRPVTRSKEWVKVKGGMRKPGLSGGSSGRSDGGCKCGC